MKFKKILRALCIGAAAVAITGVAIISGCTIETKHARAKITVEFNEETYVLEYTLYRNMYPVTVRHFIELAEEGFYDNTIIHNYTSTDWYGGGYKYVSESTEEADSYSDSYANSSMDDYLEENDKESDYKNLFYSTESGSRVYSGKITASVYKIYDDYDSSGEMTVSDDEAYYTLYGEFSNNGHTIENGERDAIKGSLKMYYTAKTIEDSAAAQVFVKTNKKEVLVRDYEYNSATSLFAIQVSDSSALSTSSYATFGSLRSDDDLDTLEDLLEAIEDYIDDNYNGDDSEFTSTAEDVYINREEEIAEPADQVSYTVTEEPIIIRTVKITKY